MLTTRVYLTPRSSSPQFFLISIIMTRPPAKREYDASWLYNLAPDSVHIINLVNQAKDGEYAEDELSDRIFGMILWALDEDGLIEEENGALCLQAPFWRENRKILSVRQTHEHIT
jgi:hypothetical protein